MKSENILLGSVTHKKMRQMKKLDSRDKLSGLLNNRAAKKYITWCLKKMKSEDISGMFLIDLDNFQQLNETFGHMIGDHVIRQAGQILSSLFRGSDIVSRLERDEFIVFISGGITKEEIYEKADTLCQELRFNIMPQAADEVTVSVGLCIISGQGMNFDRAYSQALSALEQAKQRGGDGYCAVFASRKSGSRDSMETGPMPAGFISNDMLLKYIDEGIGLLEAGPQIQIIYANTVLCQMSGSEDSSFQFPCSLKQLGIHPDYEGEYEQLLRTAAREGSPAEHIHPISRNGKEWRWRQVKAVPVHNFSGRYPVFLELSADISHLIDLERRLKESNERIRTVVGQKACLIWEVDIEKKEYHLFDINTQSCVDDGEIKKFPETFFENKRIHSDSIAHFREFAVDILSGKPCGNGNFIMWDMDDGCYRWFTMSYRMIYNRDKVPIKAIGVQERLPIPGTGFARRPLPETLRHHLVARMKVNLTTDFIEDVWKEGMDQISSLKGKTYSEIIENEPFQLFVKAEEMEFEERFKRKSLLDAFEKGDLWSSAEYRRIDSGGNIRWLSEAVNLVKDPETGDIYMYACFNDIQQRHNWEKLLGSEVERDGVSGLYDASTVKALVKQLIINGKGTTCAMGMIHMGGGFAKLWESGIDYGQKRRHFLAVALSFALGTDCVVGQYKEDMVLAFFPKAGSKFDMKRRFEDAFSYIHTTMNGVKGIDGIRFVAGIAMDRIEAADYEDLLLKTCYLCELWKNSATDTIVFPEGDEDWLHLKIEDEMIGVHQLQPEEKKEMTEEEKSVVFQCVTSMLGASTLKSSMENVLQCLGTHYQADRTYILELSEDKKTVNMLYEWNRQGKQSICHIMSEMQVSKIPLLERCLQERKPVFIENKAQSCEEKREGWCFSIFPLQDGKDMSGFFCIENAKKYRHKTLLTETVISYIMQEKKRYQLWREDKEDTGEEFLERLPNLRSYLDTIHTFDSDVYSSMGALSLDIPNFSAINSSRGFGYGKKLLIDVACTLRDIFGKDLIFHTWDAEFVALYPNTILEVFIGRCTRLRNTLQRRYPKQLRIGYTWSEGMFSARNLVREAQSIMRCENVKEDTKDRAAFLNKQGIDGQNTIADRNFIAYFQPKINMKDGSLAGAEALVRGIDNKGNIILPGQFIETLEKNGSIREMDLYILEYVMGQLSRWKEKGLPPIKVSVNISRFTLLNPTTLASILAIQSHYPDVAADQIELEITETAGDIEKATLRDVVDHFREFGLEFELDDFGSHYANVSIFTNIKFKVVKLDRSLISEIPGNEMSQMLIEDIVKICHNFDISCVAEGVETKQQRDALLKAGCIYGQGFYYSRPLPPWKFEEQYLKQNDLGGTLNDG